MNMIDTGQSISITTLAHAQGANRLRTEAMRSHAQARLIHITKGQGRITIAGLTTGYGPNNLIYIPPHTMYGMEAGPTVFAQMLALPAPADWPATPFHLRLVDVARQAELTGHIDAIERELKPGGHPRAAACHLGLLEVHVARLLATMPQAVDDPRRNSAAARLVARYTALIAADVPHLRSVAAYADDLGVTPTHLTRSCRKTCGRSALWLLNARLYDEACRMLRDTALPVGRIADHLGFGSAAYFARSFQSRAGVSPSAFRQTLSPVRAH